MGMGAEMMMEAMIDEMIIEGRIQDALDKGIWITNEGEYIKITEMDSDHLRNSFFFLQRGEFYHGYESEYKRLLKKEMKRRGF